MFSCWADALSERLYKRLLSSRETFFDASDFLDTELFVCCNLCAIRLNSVLRLCVVERWCVVTWQWETDFVRRRKDSNL